MWYHSPARRLPQVKRRFHDLLPSPKEHAAHLVSRFVLHPQTKAEISIDRKHYHVLLQGCRRYARTRPWAMQEYPELRPIWMPDRPPYQLRSPLSSPKSRMMTPARCRAQSPKTEWTLDDDDRSSARWEEESPDLESQQVDIAVAVTTTSHTTTSSSPVALSSQRKDLSHIMLVGIFSLSDVMGSS